MGCRHSTSGGIHLKKSLFENIVIYLQFHYISSPGRSSGRAIVLPLALAAALAEALAEALAAVTALVKC